MRTLMTIVTLLLLLAGLLLSAPIDTGMKQWEQPNGVTFTAHLRGDEFFIQFTTDDGYEIREGSDGWYYYAVYNDSDYIVPSDKKVAIDPAPAGSYNLQYSAAELQEINDLRAQFREELRIAGERYRQKREAASGNAVTLTVGVILVDFADTVHWKTSDPPYPFPNGYDKHYFTELIFSQNYWIDDDPIQEPNPHPEHQLLFGSLRDYYNQQSLDMLDITGEVLNPEDPQYPYGEIRESDLRKITKNDLIEVSMSYLD